MRRMARYRQSETLSQLSATPCQLIVTKATSARQSSWKTRSFSHRARTRTPSQVTLTSWPMMMISRVLKSSQVSARSPYPSLQKIKNQVNRTKVAAGETAVQKSKSYSQTKTVIKASSLIVSTKKALKSRKIKIN